jgi:tRNA A-37 threonylcarbamoyl transferase component Bud32
VGPPRSKIAAPIGSGSRLGKFVVTRSIGRGGMCEVFEARHEDLNKLVAVKVLKPEYTLDPTIVDRFLREGRAASRVRHRHAIDMLDVGTHDGVVYLAMEFLAGEDLSSRLKREGALPVEVSVDLVLPVLAAIVEAHDCGVVHRDLKPANIFLATNRRGQVEPKVLDFGISKVADDAQMQTATETLLGTPAFMAPEQIRSARSSSPASDQYSLGVILYQCVTGRLPFRGENPFATFELVVKGEHPRASSVNPAVPGALDLVLARAMALDPAARFPSVAHLGGALLPFASVGARALWAPAFQHGPEAAPTVIAPRADLASPAGGTITQASVQVQTPSRPPTAARPSRHVALIAVGVFSLTTSVTTLIVRARSTRTATVAAPAVAEAPPPTAPVVPADEPDAAPEAPQPPDVPEAADVNDAAAALDDAVVQQLRVEVEACRADPAPPAPRPARATARPSRPRLVRDPNGALDIR